MPKKKQKYYTFSKLWSEGKIVSAHLQKPITSKTRLRAILIEQGYKAQIENNMFVYKLTDEDIASINRALADNYEENKRKRRNQ